MEATKCEQGEKAKAKAEGQVGKIGPAVLTNQGVEEAKSRRALWLGFVGALVIGAGLYWLLFSSSPQRAALEAYTAEVDSVRVRAGKRIQSIQERAWLITLPPADIGVPPFLIASSVIAIMAQRLVRVNCPKCREPSTPTDAEIRAWLRT